MKCFDGLRNISYNINQLHKLYLFLLINQYDLCFPWCIFFVKSIVQRAKIFIFHILYQTPKNNNNNNKKTKLKLPNTFFFFSSYCLILCFSGSSTTIKLLLLLSLLATLQCSGNSRRFFFHASVGADMFLFFTLK